MSDYFKNKYLLQKKTKKKILKIKNKQKIIKISQKTKDKRQKTHEINRKRKKSLLRQTHIYRYI